jgi:transposase
VPSEDAETGRQLHRELEVLKKERTMHRNRLKGLLIRQGISRKIIFSQRVFLGHQHIF